MFVINCCEHVSPELEAEHHVIERLVNACANYGLKSLYDRAMIEGGPPERQIHLRQILSSPAHAAMEHTRNELRDALRKANVASL